MTSLRLQGVLIVGAGSLTHNLYEFRRASLGGDAAYAREFADWSRETVVSKDRASSVRAMELAPNARRAHHYRAPVPLMLAAGAAGSEAPVTVDEGGITHGVLAMDSSVFGQIAGRH